MTNKYEYPKLCDQSTDKISTPIAETNFTEKEFSVRPSCATNQRGNSNNSSNRHKMLIESSLFKFKKHFKQVSPRKSPYVPASPPQKKNAINSSHKQPVVKYSNSANISKNETPFTVKGSIYATKTKGYNEIAADVTRSDCKNRGYKIKQTIGEGAYAKVKLAEMMSSKLARNPSLADLADERGMLQVAIKVIDNKAVPKEFLNKFLPRELSNHCPLPPHPNVVRVHEQFKTVDRYYVVMDYCSKGDLLDLINQTISKNSKGMEENTARRLFTMIVDGLHHIHSNGIVHRDLKCENILLDDTDTIKITDFGFSTRFVPGNDLLKTSCGSYAYTAPEIIQMKSYNGIKSDTWSLGVILFAMLNGRLPFNDAKFNNMEEDMLMQRLRFERTVSFESMVLVRRILQYHPENRPTIIDILNDVWLTGKRMIPRQVANTKRINSTQATKDDSAGTTLVSTNPHNHKPRPPERRPPERGSDAIVTLNQDKNETVILKSRTGNKKNIWTSGPPVSPRPNTWPRYQVSTPTHKPKPKRGSRRHVGPRGTATSCREVRVKQSKPNANTCQSGYGDGEAQAFSKTAMLSKWYMGMYCNKTDSKEPQQSTEFQNVVGGKKSVTHCGSCKAEAIALIESNRSNTSNMDAAEMLIDAEDFRFPSPVKNIGDTTYDTTQGNNSIDKTGAITEQKRETKQIAAKPEHRFRNVTSTNKPQENSPNKKCLVSYMLSRLYTSPERVKFFRDRLEKPYITGKHVGPDLSDLPPLIVQITVPPKVRTATCKTPKPPPKSASSYVRNKGRTSSGTCRGRIGSTGTKIQLAKRVVVHSAVS